MRFYLVACVLSQGDGNRCSNPSEVFAVLANDESEVLDLLHEAGKISTDEVYVREMGNVTDTYKPQILQTGKRDNLDICYFTVCHQVSVPEEMNNPENCRKQHAKVLDLPENASWTDIAHRSIELDKSGQLDIDSFSQIISDYTLYH